MLIRIVNILLNFGFHLFDLEFRNFRYVLAEILHNDVLELSNNVLICYLVFPELLLTTMGLYIWLLVWWVRTLLLLLIKWEQKFPVHYLEFLFQMFPKEYQTCFLQ